MKFRNQLKYHLTKLLNCSYKQAIEYCNQGAILVDNQIINDSSFTLVDSQEIKFNNQVIRRGITYLYVIFNKPYLYECTANRSIPNSIYEILPQQYQHLFSLGRLDKNSEGLLLLTNDGSVYAKMVNMDTNIEKEYLVTVYHPIDAQLETAFIHPFLLGKRYTKPAKFTKISEFQFSLILTEGINRQIRRICAKNNNQVKQLIRTRFGSYTLGDLKPGECKQLSNILAL